jgi:hypothetical protein
MELNHTYTGHQIEHYPFKENSSYKERDKWSESQSKIGIIDRWGRVKFVFSMNLYMKLTR